jgi:ketosteroid isomerase-like protein
MTTALFHEDITYKLHVASTSLPFGGEWRGIEACRDALFSLLEEFDYLSYVPTILSVRGSVVRAQVSFKYQHRRTGGILEGTRRLVFNVQNGLIVRVNGYHDARLVEAFIRLTEHRIATNQLAKSPQLPRRERQGSA